MQAVERWSLGCLAAFCIAVCCLALILSLAARQLPKPLAEAPLTAGFDGDLARMSRNFDKRLRTTFPVGSPENLMRMMLVRQGFVVTDQGIVTVAVRREGLGICSRTAYVHWRADRSGHIVTVWGEFKKEPCL